MRTIILTIISALALTPAMSAASADVVQNDKDSTAIKRWIDNLVESEMDEYLANMPNIEVGKGVSFSPKDNSFKTTLRFRMQNLAGANFDDKMKVNDTDGQVKRLRLRFDGYIFSPKFIYSIQLGFTGRTHHGTSDSARRK